MKRPAAAADDKPHLVGTFILPRTSFSRLGNPACSDEELAKARSNGLKYADLPSIGSGLAKLSENEFVGITDRGPNGTATTSDGRTRRTFPLPRFCPTIVRFKLNDGQIQIEESIPLKDRRNHPISGLSNTEGDERLYESADSKEPLPLDPNGVDPEGIRVLPNGNFLLVEEYAPSILVVSPQGQVLVRYTPASKPLPQATYPTKPILPNIFTQRRINKGFECLALSGDGKFAYAILQSPMGDSADPRFRNSRVARALKLDVSQPLAARVVGEYLLLTSPASTYSAQQAQSKISFSDAEWLGPERLLLIERGKGLVKLVLQDFSQATNVQGRMDSSNLDFENVATDLDALRVQPAQARTFCSTRDVPGLPADKLEGLALIGPDEIALSNDNDFGLGDKATGEPSRIWLVRIPALIQFTR